MPNHVRNLLQVSGQDEDVRALWTFVCRREPDPATGEVRPVPDTMDFGRVIPVPETIRAMEDKGDFTGPRDGKLTPHSWRVRNWGTKWNAYEVDPVESFGMRFCTAWSPPVPVLQALSAKFPALTLTLAYADEFLGQNCGWYSFAGGETVHAYEPQSMRESVELGLFCWGVTASDAGLLLCADRTEYLSDCDTYFPLWKEPARGYGYLELGRDYPLHMLPYGFMSAEYEGRTLAYDGRFPAPDGYRLVPDGQTMCFAGYLRAAQGVIPGTIRRESEFLPCAPPWEMEPEVPQGPKNPAPETADGGARENPLSGPDPGSLQGPGMEQN